MKVGLTGGIGSGKSFVARLLHDKGFLVFDCDEQAKRLMVQDDTVVRLITDAVGDDAYFYNVDDGLLNSGGSSAFDDEALPHSERVLNKKAVAAFLFRSPDNAAVINGIVHPRLATVFTEWADRSQAELVFMESAILFESGFNALVDRTVCVVADERLRIQRAADRNNARYDDVVRRVRLQDSQDKIMMRSDFVLYNNANDNLQEQIDKLIHDLKAEIGPVISN